MIVPTFSLNLSDFKSKFMRTTLKSVHTAQQRNLIHLGGWIKVVSKRSIKNPGKRAMKKAGGEIYSKPGNPPFNKIGLLKQFILSGYDGATESILVGAAHLNRRTGAPAALEGTSDGKVMVNIRQRWRQLSGGLWVKDGPPTRKEARYILPRPFMAPALAKAKKEKKFEAFWKDSI